MKKVLTVFLGVTCLASVAVAQPPADNQEQPAMSFFVTSVGMGKGGDLGGLDGADSHCQALAEAAGSEGKTWKAYLSTQEKDGEAAVNARDRIGEGPWHNYYGLQMAANLDSLHYDNSAFVQDQVVTESGNTINSRTIRKLPNEHDILTGTNMDGTAIAGDEDRTCSNWTSSDEGSAMVGHSDRHRFTTLGSSWNAAHPSRGCSQESLVGTGGAGFFYCFAID